LSISQQPATLHGIAASPASYCGCYLTGTWSTSGVSNSDCSVGHTRTYKVTRGSIISLTQQYLYLNVLERAFTFYFLPKVQLIICN